MATKPRPWVCVQDSREQLPWQFDGIPTVVRKLDAGDYSVEGLENVIAIERKSLSDFLGSITFGRARFEAEMDRLASYERALIVVEAHLDTILRGAYRSSVTPQAIVGSVASIHSRWGVATVFIGGLKNEHPVYAENDGDDFAADRRAAQLFARIWLTKSAKRAWARRAAA